MPTFEEQLDKYTNIGTNNNFKIAGTDINEDITLTTATATGSVPYRRTSTQQSQALGNIKPRKKYKFTYLKDKSDLIDFKGIPDTANRVRDIANSYNINNINNYLKYAREQANISGHECGPTHDEKVKWRLRDIQSQELNPMLDKVNYIKNRVQNEPCLTGDCYESTITDYNSKIDFLNKYIAELGNIIEQLGNRLIIV